MFFLNTLNTNTQTIFELDFMKSIEENIKLLKALSNNNIVHLKLNSVDMNEDFLWALKDTLVKNITISKLTINGLEGIPDKDGIKLIKLLCPIVKFVDNSLKVLDINVYSSNPFRKMQFNLTPKSINIFLERLQYSSNKFHSVRFTGFEFNAVPSYLATLIDKVQNVHFEFHHSDSKKAERDINSIMNDNALKNKDKFIISYNDNRVVISSKEGIGYGNINIDDDNNSKLIQKPKF